MLPVGRTKPVSDRALFTCPVCGHCALMEDPLPLFNTHEICECCGVQFGLEVSSCADIAACRQRWLESGAEWFHTETQPQHWGRSEAVVDAVFAAPVAPLPATDPRKRNHGALRLVRHARECVGVVSELLR